MRSACQWRGKPRDELDQIGLARNAGLFEQAAKMSLDGRGGNTECRGYLGHAADIRRWHASTRSSVGVNLSHLADHLIRRGRLQRRPANEQGGDRIVGKSRTTSGARCQRQHMDEVAFTVIRGQRAAPCP